MRIGLYAPFYHPFEGGAERVVRRVAHELARRHEVTVFTLRFRPELPSDEQDGAVRVLRAPARTRSLLGFTRQDAPALLGLLDRAQPDLLQIHGATFPDLGLAVARRMRRRGIPTLLVPHGLAQAVSGSYHNSVARRASYRVLAWPLLALLCRGASHVAVLSSASLPVARRLGVPRARLSVVGNGFEPPDSAGASATRFRERSRLPSERILLQVAALKPNKGHETILAALPRLLERFPDLAYVAAGGAQALWEDYAAHLHHLAGRPEQGGHARLVGHLEPAALADAYAAAELVLLPSLEEDLPLALLDALAWGKPVVASRVGGIPDAVESDVSGLLVPPGDPRALADAIAGLLADAAGRARLGANAARQVRERFGWDAVIARYEALCASLLTRGEAGLPLL